MELSLKGKRAVVCGSTQGIGRACAQELAKQGASITLLARDEQRLISVRDSLHKAEGQHHEYLVADFGDSAQVHEVAGEYSQRCGAVHILVNNTAGPPAGKIFDARPMDFLQAFHAHLINNHHLVQAFVPLMKQAGYGRIINIISTSVKIPLENLGVSNTVRGAVASWAKTLANELAAFGITVNNVLPGATLTGRLESLILDKAQKTGQSPEAVKQTMLHEIPARRFGLPEEIAYAVAFLASPAAAYITGVSLPVDGGRTGSL